ncbi:MAG: YabP/YqfC family sporulation protein [Ruminococcus sp.]|nr:YabP/YqfC family sporulation protein [Ruminococcus sp.]
MHEKIKQKFYLDSEIFISGNREIIIENCKRIEEYNEVFIRLVSGGLHINIWGDSLKAYDFRTDSLVIRGKISRIELEN